jgi:hypothetical protein
MVRRSLLALALAIGAASTASGQYEIVSHVPGTWIDIAATGTPLSLDDDQSVQISNTVSNAFLPANAWVNSNGSIGAGEFDYYVNTLLPNSDFHSGRGLAMFWDDLDPELGGTIHWQQIGSTLVVQFTDVPFWGSAAENNTFQVQVFSSGDTYAQFLYQGTMGTLRQRGADATIGAQLNPSTAFQYSYNQNVLSFSTVLTLRAQNPSAIGACCFNDGSCQFITRANCDSGGGSFAGENVTCAQASCPQPSACCLAGGQCQLLLPLACATQSGVYQGTGSTCGSVNCPQHLTTLFSSNNNGGFGGIIYFDLSVTSAISLQAIATNTDALGPIGATIYSVPNSYIGNAGNPFGWTLLSTANGLGIGLDQPSVLTLDTPTILNPGNYGIAIVGSFTHHYTEGTGANQFFSNADVAVTLGMATDDYWDLIEDSVWNGTLYYHRDGVPPVPTTQELLNTLINNVQLLNLQQGINNSLDAKLQRVRDALESVRQNSRTQAINALGAFMHEVAAQSGNHLPAGAALELFQAAQHIIERLLTEP